jgi:hypothetical protein
MEASYHWSPLMVKGLSLQKVAMTESEKRIAPFGLRLPPELKERVQDAAEKGNQSMNALIMSVLEREFPHPTINLHDVAALLNTLANEVEDESGFKGEGAYFAEVNKGLASAKSPWYVHYDDGRLIFYPCASPDTPR